MIFTHRPYWSFLSHRDADLLPSLQRERVFRGAFDSRSIGAIYGYGRCSPVPLRAFYAFGARSRPVAKAPGFYRDDSYRTSSYVECRASLSNNDAKSTDEVVSQTKTVKAEANLPAATAAVIDCAELVAARNQIRTLTRQKHFLESQYSEMHEKHESATAVAERDAVIVELRQQLHEQAKRLCSLENELAAANSEAEKWRSKYFDLLKQLNKEPSNVGGGDIEKLEGALSAIQQRIKTDMVSLQNEMADALHELEK